MALPGEPGARAGAPPTPAGARSIDELGARLRALHAWRGRSYRELHREVMRLRRARGIVEQPSYTTVFRCLQPGRTRLDVELVVDIATVLLGDRNEAARWRQAHRVIVGESTESSIVTVSDVIPDDIDRLAGRGQDVRRALDVLDSEDFGRTVAISAIDGMAGIGKTTLAIHIAHELLEHSGADLQLWVNLRGYDPDLAPANPAAVLAGFLRILGVPGSRVHALDLDARANSFRKLMAGRRAIVVLDNAADEDQVRPLLPDSPTCRVLITSRRSLSGLPSTQHLPLDLLTPAESVELLRRSAGSERVDADPDAAARITDLAGHLPLALALVAARITATPDWTLADHGERLREHRDLLRLDSGVELAFRLSYDDLDHASRRVLRLLALHPGRDFDAYTAAALASCDLDTAIGQLDVLAEANLINERAAHRFEAHDLVRVFAAHRARDEDAPRIRRDALARLFGYYRDAVSIAMAAYEPGGQQQRPENVEPGTPIPRVTDQSTAATWLDDERANLLAVVRSARSTQPSTAAEIALVVNSYLAARDDRADRLEVLTLGKEAASAAGRHDLACRLGLAEIGARRQAGDDPHQLLALSEETLTQIEEHRLSTLEAPALYLVALTAYDLCDFDRARKLAESTLDLIKASSDQAQFRANPLCLLGKIEWYAEPSDSDRSVSLLRRAVDAVTPGTRKRAIILSSLSEILTNMGKAADADRAVQEARGIVETIGDTLGRATLDVEEARVAVLQGDWHRASDRIRSARMVFEEQPDPEAEAELAIADAELAIAQDRIDDARETLIGAAERAEVSGNPFDVWRVRRLLDSAAFGVS
jgi:hypothetical protein